MNKAAFWSLWSFVFVLPWDALTDIPVLGSIPRFVGLVASAVGIVYILARGRVRPLSWFHVFVVLFVLWAGLSSFWSIDPDTTRTRLMTYVQLAVLVWLIWEIAGSPERARSLLQAYILGASAAAVVTIHHYSSGVAAGAYVERFSALNQDPNELGLTLALGVPMAWYINLSQAHRRFAWMWRLYLPLAITAILLTGSRGAFLAMLVALIIIPATQGGLRLRTKAALFALAAAALVVAASFAPETSLERLRTTRADIESGYFGGRGKIWRAGLDVAWEHPLIGVGAGAFGAAVEPTLQFAWSSHSVPLAILVEDGLVGLLLFLAAVAAAIKSFSQLPHLQRRFSIVLLFTLAVGSLSLEWEYRKQFWFILGALAAQGALRAGLHRVIDHRSSPGSARLRAAVGGGVPVGDQ
jgi:O-antigen ligase